MKALYLEPDEEITSVVDRLKEIDDEEVAIVVPKRAGLLQSIVNLKLLRFQAEQQQKRISLVTTDKTGRNLASAVGLTVYQKLPEGTKGRKAATESAVKEPVEEIPIKFRRKPPKPKAQDGSPDADDITYKKGAAPEIVTREVAGERTVEVSKTEEGTRVEVETHEVALESEVPLEQVDGERSVTDRVAGGDEAAVPLTAQPRPESSAGRTPRRSLRSAVAFTKSKLPRVRRPKGSKGPKAAAGAAGAAASAKTPKSSAQGKAAAAKPKTPRRITWKVAGAVALALLLTGTAAAAVVLPKATVTIVPKTTPVNADVPLTFSTQAPAVETEERIIPAKTIEVTEDITRQVTSTGRSEGGEKASGEITIENSLPRNQPLVARTRFQAPDGRIFRSQSAVVVPARATATVRVEADEGGASGNLPAGTALTIPGLRSTDAVTAKVDTPLAGGTDSDSVTISAADVDQATRELAAQAAREGLGSAKSKLAVGYELNPQVASTSVLDSSVSPPPGTAAERFTVSGRVKVVYFTYQQQDLQKILDPGLDTEIPAGSELTDQRTEEFRVQQASDDQLSGVMEIETFAATDVSRDQVKDTIRGKSPEEAQAELEQGGQIVDVRVALFPFWVMNIPDALDKIVINFEAGAASVPTPTPTATSTAPLLPRP